MAKNPEKCRQILAQSIENWSEDAIRQADDEAHRAIREEATQQVWRALTRSGERLARAEKLLDRGRRNSHWWHYLFQLKSQMACEKLLTGITFDSSANKGEQSGRVEFGRFTDELQGGLRAIREGLDSVLISRTEARSEGRRADVREEWLARLWIELMLFGYIWTRTLRTEHSQQILTFRRVQERVWKWHNKLADFHKYPKIDARVFEYLNRIDQAAPIRQSVAARSLALRCVRECIRLGTIRWLTRLRVTEVPDAVV